MTILRHQIVGQDGGAPGVSTAIAAALKDADSEDTPRLDTIPATAAKVFGFADSSSPLPPNQPTVFRHSKSPRHAGATARANDDDAARPPDVDLTGIYYNAGYGTVMLRSAQSPPRLCGGILATFRVIDPFLAPNSTSTDTFASSNTLFRTHIRFTYTNAS